MWTRFDFTDSALDLHPPRWVVHVHGEPGKYPFEQIWFTSPRGVA